MKCILKPCVGWNFSQNAIVRRYGGESGWKKFEKLVSGGRRRTSIGHQRVYISYNLQIHNSLFKM